MTKGHKIENFARSQLLFDVHRQYLQTFLIDLQPEVSRLSLSNFSLFAFFSEFSSIIIGFYIL